MAQAETVGLGRTSVARSFVVILAALVALGTPRSALAQGADGGTFRIGATMSITGKAYSVQGGYGREGYLLCQKHLNAQGGLLGRPVELVIYDDESVDQRGFQTGQKAVTIQWQDGKQAVV